MAKTEKTRARRAKVLGAIARAGGLVVASSLISGAAVAKNDRTDKTAKREVAGASRQDGSGKRSAVAQKVAPNSSMAMKQAPNSTMAVKTAPGSTMAVKTAPNGGSVKRPPPGH